MKRKNLKTFQLRAVFALALSVFCVSCGNIFKPDGNISSDGASGSEKSSAYVVSGSIKIHGALPQVVSSRSEKKTDVRSALPGDMGAASVSYTVTLTRSSDKKEVSRTLDPGETEFSVGIETGEWTLTVSGADASGNELLHGTYADKIVFTDSTVSAADVAVSVYPVSEGDVTGTVALNLTVTGCGIKAYKAVWTEGGSEKTLTRSNGGADLTTLNFDMVEDGTSSPDDLPQKAGQYEVVFTFYNSDATLDGSTEVFSCREYVNVFGNMTTDKWVNDASTPYISSGAFILTPAIISNRHHFYVSSSGSATNSGSYFSPLDSVKTAVERICAANDGAQYTVSLSSDDDTTAANGFEAGSNYAYVNISPAAALDLVIDGGAVVSDSTDANMSFENCIFANNKANSLNDGGVAFIHNKSTVVFDACTFSDNYAVWCGGALSIEKAGAKVTLNNCKFSGNTTGSKDGTYNGGAVYLREGECTVKDCTMNGNKCTNNGASGIDQDIGYNAETLDASLYFSGHCEISAVRYSLGINSAPANVPCIENLDTGSKIGIELNSYNVTLPCPVVKVDITQDISPYKNCFTSVNTGYKIVTGTSTAELYIQTK